MNRVKFETLLIVLLLFVVGFLGYKLYFIKNKSIVTTETKSSIINALDKIQKSNSASYIGYDSQRKLSIAEDIAEISGILDQKSTEIKHIDEKNSTAKNLNYIFNKNYKNTFIKESLQNEYTINSLVTDINNKEYKNCDTKKLAKTLEKKYIYVFLGHFKESEAIKLAQYFEYQGFDSIIKVIDKKYHFVLVKFETIKSANEFKIWAINQGLFDTKIIKN